MITPKATILAADDDSSALFLLENHLKMFGFKTITASNGREALQALMKYSVNIIISDQVMPVMDGFELLKEVKIRFGDIPFIMLTAHGSIEKAVASMKQGAYDYIEKPCDIDELFATVGRALDYYRLSEENKKLKGQLRSLYTFQHIVTRSPLMMTALKLSEKVAAAPNTTVAIYGESGTGKEVLARAIHYAGERMENRFVVVNCAGIPSTLLESELFGYVKGAFTGAEKDREGKFSLAQHGTMLLDEIGDMPLELQVKLLRVLEDRRYERLGSNEIIETDLRVIVATHRNLADMVNQGKFREDLYHRINIFPITLPPLRDRKEDIRLLIDYFLKQLRTEFGKSLPGLSQKAMELILSYHWPGNIRELKNCLERAAIIIEGELIRPEHLTITNSPFGDKKDFSTDRNKIHIDIDLDSKETSLDIAINQILQKTLERCNNNKSTAAEILKVNRQMFYRRKPT